MAVVIVITNKPKKLECQEVIERKKFIRIENLEGIVNFRDDEKNVNQEMIQQYYENDDSIDLITWMKLIR